MLNTLAFSFSGRKFLEQSNQIKPPNSMAAKKKQAKKVAKKATKKTSVKRASKKAAPKKIGKKAVKKTKVAKKVSKKKTAVKRFMAEDVRFLKRCANIIAVSIARLLCVAIALNLIGAQMVIVNPN